MSKIMCIKPYIYEPSWNTTGMIVITGGDSVKLDASTILQPDGSQEEQMLFLYVESGSVRIRTDNSDATLAQDSCVIAECIYHPIITGTFPSRIRLYTFCGSPCSHILDLMGFKTGTLHITDYSKTDRQNILLQLDELDKLRDSRDDLSILMRSQIFQNIITRYIKINYNDQSRNIMDTSLPRHIKICIDYMNKNYASEISLDTLSAECGINKFTLSRDFSSFTGTSPIQFLKNKRIDVAKGFLQKSTLSIRDVGIAAGIPDTTNFIRTFKKHTGTTPLKYRNRFL
ncbi:MAG: helix-turn-helix transcriptional regulator [Clostridiales bacterium]|nr:helix-turn-helix transcriptional regulator [Clostridiales bacterium]